jgi:hypothetical protein
MKRVVEGYGPLRLGTLLIVLTIVVPPPRACAELGGDIGSVYQDSDKMGGKIETRAVGKYSVCEIKVSSGTTVREFVSPNGTVFGVAWEGPFVPDMKQILGLHFEQYSEAVRAATPKYSRRPISIRLPGLVFETGGHMGWYYGRAYVPEALPDVAAERLVH